MTTERPVCVTVIGWGAIAVGVLAAFGGFMGLALHLFVPMGRRPSPEFSPLDAFMVGAAVQLLIGAVLIFAGRGLLRLQAWASRVIQVVAWLALLYAAAFAVYFVRELVTTLAGPQRPANASQALVFMGVFSFFVLLFWCTPPVLTIRSLRSERVRRSLQAQAAGEQGDAPVGPREEGPQ